MKRGRVRVVVGVAASVALHGVVLAVFAGRSAEVVRAARAHEARAVMGEIVEVDVGDRRTENGDRRNFQNGDRHNFRNPVRAPGGSKGGQRRASASEPAQITETTGKSAAAPAGSPEITLGPISASGAAEMTPVPISSGVTAEITPGPISAGGAAEITPVPIFGPELHARLSEAAQRCYPPAARRHRLTGHVEVAFCVDPHGAVLNIERHGSTGSAILDRAAESCVVQGAAPLPAPEGCYAVPIQFR